MYYGIYGCDCCTEFWEMVIRCSQATHSNAAAARPATGSSGEHSNSSRLNSTSSSNMNGTESNDSHGYPHSDSTATAVAAAAEMQVAQKLRALLVTMAGSMQLSAPAAIAGSGARCGSDHR